MELPLFHGQPALDFRIEKVPEGFYFVPERQVSYDTYVDFHQWGLRIRLFEELIIRPKICDNPVEYELVVCTEYGWRKHLAAALDAADVGPLRTYFIGSFYLRQDNYVLFRMKFEGVK